MNSDAHMCSTNYWLPTTWKAPYEVQQEKQEVKHSITIYKLKTIVPLELKSNMRNYKATYAQISNQ